MYHDKRKILSWVGGPEGTRTSDQWGAHLRLDQLSYPLGLTSNFNLKGCTGAFDLQNEIQL